MRVVLVRVVLVRVVLGRLAVVVDDEQGKQDDGDNLQGQGQDGELEPHVGGVGRHPSTGVSLSLAPLALSAPFFCSSCLSSFFPFCFCFFQAFAPCGGRDEGDARF